jgi:hypothetical protein
MQQVDKYYLRSLKCDASNYENKLYICMLKIYVWDKQFCDRP